MAIFTSFVGYTLGGLMVGLIGLLVLIQSLAGNQHLFDRWNKALCRVIPAFFGIRVTVKGAEGLKDGGPRIYMANHVNIFDPILLYGYIPQFVRSVELEDHFSWPVWGGITRRMGNIPISHRNVAKALESLEAAREALSRGTSIGILPEGHRTRDGRLQPFMRGAFRLAGQAGVDIVPIAMKGLWERKTVHSMLVRPGAVELDFGEPITAAEAAELTERELRDRVRTQLSGMLNR